MLKAPTVVDIKLRIMKRVLEVKNNLQARLPYKKREINNLVELVENKIKDCKEMAELTNYENQVEVEHLLFNLEIAIRNAKQARKIIRETQVVNEKIKLLSGLTLKE